MQARTRTQSCVRSPARLERCGLSVWYYEFELKIGDSLRRKIDHGIANSRFGIVFFRRLLWEGLGPAPSLDGPVTMAVSGAQVLLPLWHEISKDEVMRQSPSIGRQGCLRTSDYGVEEIASEIAAVIRGTTSRAE